MTAVSGSIPLLLPSPCMTGSALSCSLSGQHVGAASFTLCYGLLLCFPSSGSYNASTQSVTRLHRLPAIRRPDTYRNWTSTSEQMMTFQDTPCFVGWRFAISYLCLREARYEIASKANFSRNSCAENLWSIGFDNAEVTAHKKKFSSICDCFTSPLVIIKDIKLP